jgi:hypothetical protein
MPTADRLMPNTTPIKEEGLLARRRTARGRGVVGFRLVVEQQRVEEGMVDLDAGIIMDQ